MRVCKLLTTLLVRTEFMECSAKSSRDDESDNPSSRGGTPPMAGDLGPMSPKGWSLMICIYKLSMRSFPFECIRQTDGHYLLARLGISKDTRTCFSDRSKYLSCGLTCGGGVLGPAQPYVAP